jgi:hypothetical protein
VVGRDRGLQHGQLVGAALVLSRPRRALRREPVRQRRPDLDDVIGAEPGDGLAERDALDQFDEGDTPLRLKAARLLGRRSRGTPSHLPRVQGTTPSFANERPEILHDRRRRAATGLVMRPS